MPRLERDGRLVRGARRPAPRQEAAPCARQGPYGGLRGWALVALLRGVPLRPARRPERRGRPCDARVSKALWTLETPVHPGCLAAPFGHRRDPGICLACGSGGRALAWCAAGDAPLWG